MEAPNGGAVISRETKLNNQKSNNRHTLLVTAQIESVESNVANGEFLRSYRCVRTIQAIMHANPAAGAELTRVESRLQDSNSVVL